MKLSFKKIVIFLVIIFFLTLLSIGIFIFLSKSNNCVKYGTLPEITKEECFNLGGGIINTLESQCCAKYDFLGTIVGSGDNFYICCKGGEVDLEPSKIEDKNDFKVWSIASSPEAVSVGSNGNIRFSVRVTGGNEDPEFLNLLINKEDSFEKIGILKDDGKDGDLVSGDRVYGGRIEISTERESSFLLKATFVHNEVEYKSPVYKFHVTKFPIGIESSDIDSLVIDSETETKFFSNEIMVSFKEDVSPERIREILFNEDCYVAGSLLNINIYQIRFSGKGTVEGVYNLIEKIEKYEEVEYAEPNYFEEFISRKIDLIIEEKTDKFIFTADIFGEVYIPKAGLYSPSYLSGPWSVYYFNPEKEKWEEVRIGNLCISPWCDDFEESCNPPVALCDTIPHPPYCDIASKNHLFEWDKKEVINKKIYCDDLERFCYERSLVKSGEYKVVFSYKNDFCPEITNHYQEKIEVFQNNIKKIEKTFFIKGS